MQTAFFYLGVACAAFCIGGLVHVAFCYVLYKLGASK